MKAQIISTEEGHVIHREGRSRPFQICSNGRMRSFATLSAATAAAKQARQDALEMNAIIEKARQNAVTG